MSDSIEINAFPHTSPVVNFSRVENWYDIYDMTSSTRDFFDKKMIRDFIQKSFKKDLPLPSNLVNINGIIYFEDNLTPITSKARKRVHPKMDKMFIFNYESIVPAGDFEKKKIRWKKYKSRDIENYYWITNMYFASESKKVNVSSCIIQNSIFKNIEVFSNKISIFINCKFSNCIIDVKKYYDNAIFSNCTFENCKFVNMLSAIGCSLNECDMRNIDVHADFCSFKLCNFEGGMKFLRDVRENLTGYVGSTKIKITISEDIELKLTEVNTSLLEIRIEKDYVEKKLEDLGVETRLRSILEHKSQLILEEMLSKSTVYRRKECKIFPYLKSYDYDDDLNRNFIDFDDFECGPVRRGERS